MNLNKRIELELANILMEEIRFLIKILFLIEHEIDHDKITKFIKDYKFNTM